MDFSPPSMCVLYEFEKLVNRLNPPRVSIDNSSCKNATLIEVDSANKSGSLLKVAQVLNELNLIIKKAYISSDGRWFMDVFHVTDEYGNKIYETNIVERIEKSLVTKIRNAELMERTVPVEPAPEHTTIELLGKDRPGLLSEVCAVLTDLRCNVVAAHVWTHNSRMASVVHVTDDVAKGAPIEDPDRLSRIKQLLLYVLRGNHLGGAAVSAGGTTNPQRRLHQIFYADRDFDDRRGGGDGSEEESRRAKPVVTLEDCRERGYTVVHVVCRDRPKLLFDTVCTITDMGYVIHHGNIVAEGPEAEQEYYIRHSDERPISSLAESQRVIQCLEAAIKRRASEGIRLQLIGHDRVGFLSEVTRVFREHGMMVTRAEVATKATQAVNVFYVTDASGQPVKSETIESVQKELGQSILEVKEEHTSYPQKKAGRFSQLASLFRWNPSEKSIFHNMGLVRPC